MALVTVGIPTTGRSYLRAAIDSVRAQSLTEWTLLVADNANTPEAAELVRAYDDPRIRYAGHPRDLGFPGNCNFLLESADTPYTAILHDDDRYHPDYLATTIRALREHPTARWAFANAWFCREDSGEQCRWIHGTATTFFPARERLLQRLALRDFICCPSVIFTREAAAAARFNPLIPYCADWELWTRLAGAFDAVYVGQPLLYYRFLSGSSTDRAVFNLRRDCRMAHDYVYLFSALRENAALECLRPRIEKSLRRELKRLCRRLLALAPDGDIAPFLDVLDGRADGTARVTRWLLGRKTLGALLGPPALAYERRQAARHAAARPLPEFLFDEFAP